MTKRFVDLLDTLGVYLKDYRSKYSYNVLPAKLFIELKTNDGVLYARVNDVDLLIDNESNDLANITLKGDVEEYGQIHLTNEELKAFNDFIRGGDEEQVKECLGMTVKKFKLFKDYETDEEGTQWVNKLIYCENELLSEEEIVDLLNELNEKSEKFKIMYYCLERAIERTFERYDYSDEIVTNNTILQDITDNWIEMIWLRV